jgi:hypothetical protein
MKAMNSKWLSVLTLSLMIPLSGFGVPAEGGNSGGGGDASEARVNEIRSDILSWIGKGGAQNLILPTGMSYGQYEDGMKDILAPKKVVIGFIEKDDVKDSELQVSVGGVPKTCRGFISKKDLAPHILCNISRFKATSDSDQYRLIHHEYAGLARIEKNENAASDYEISNQLTDYLTFQKVLRLAVKTPDVSVDRPGLGTAILKRPGKLLVTNYMSLEKCPDIADAKLPCKDIEKDLNGQSINSRDIDKLLLRPGKYRMYVWTNKKESGESIKDYSTINFNLGDREIKRLTIAEVQTQIIPGPGKVKIQFYKKDVINENEAYIRAEALASNYKTCLIATPQDRLDLSWCARINRVLKMALNTSESDNVRRMAKSITDSGKVTIEQFVKMMMVVENTYEYSGVSASEQKILKRAEARKFLLENNDYMVADPDDASFDKDSVIVQKVEYKYFDFALSSVDPGASVFLPNGQYLVRYTNESGDEWTKDLTVNDQEEITLE